MKCLEHRYKNNLQKGYKYYLHGLCDISLPQEVWCISHPLIKQGQNYNIIFHAENDKTLHLH